MAELLTAINEPAFNWYPQWIELNEKGEPKNPIKDGMSQPPTIKILWSTPNGREMSCDVTPDKARFGPEYALAYTIPDFETKLLVRWEKDHKEDPEYINKKFDLFRSCLQGVAVTKWDLCAAKYDKEKRSEKTFKKCVKDYLEAVAKCTNLGDQVIRWLRLRGKPAHMRFEEFLNRRVQILNYVKNGYLRHRMDLPVESELCEQVFLAQPKAHQVKYAEKHRVVETDMLKLQEFFEGCHDADVRSGEYARIMESKKKPKEGSSAKASSRRDRDRHSDRRNRQERDRYEYRPYDRRPHEDRPYTRDPPRQDRRDRERPRHDKTRRDSDRGYAKAAESTKDRKGGHHAHHIETGASLPRSRSRSRSAESSVREVKKIRVRSPSRERSRSRSTDGSEENYHLQSGDSPMKDEENPNGWGRKTAAKGNVVTLETNDGWGRKNPPEESKPAPAPPQRTPEIAAAIQAAARGDKFVLPHHDRHRDDPPRWYREISRAPRQVNDQNDAIGLGSFFKRDPYDYTDEELNLPQGHADRIRTVDLLPEDRKRREDADDDSILPSDWLERTAELHRAGLDHCHGVGTWRRLMMGDLMSQYGAFHTNAERQFGNFRAQMNANFMRETESKVTDLKTMNAKRNLPPNAGVEQLKKERAVEFKAYIASFLDGFKAKSRRHKNKHRE